MNPCPACPFNDYRREKENKMFSRVSNAKSRFIFLSAHGRNRWRRPLVEDRKENKTFLSSQCKIFYILLIFFSFYFLIWLKINKYVVIHRKSLKITKQNLFSSTYVDPCSKQKYHKF